MAQTATRSTRGRTATVTPDAAPASAPRLRDDQLGELMELLKGTDTVELKATVPVDAHRSAVQGLPMDPVEAEPRQVWFFDTPDLALNAAGIVVRARRRQGGIGDTVVKLRPVVPEQLPGSLRRQAGFNVEVDVLPGGFVASASFKGRVSGDDVREAGLGKLPLKQLFSKPQREFFRAHAPEGLTMGDLVPLGPTFLLKARFGAKLAPKMSQLLVAEMWLYPSGSPILELSTKCPPADAFAVAGATRAYLLSHGVRLAAEQQTKTKTALEFYSAALRDAAGEDGQAAD
jgi:hypothetical protein